MLTYRQVKHQVPASSTLTHNRTCYSTSPPNTMTSQLNNTTTSGLDLDRIQSTIDLVSIVPTRLEAGKQVLTSPVKRPSTYKASQRRWSLVPQLQTLQRKPHSPQIKTSQPNTMFLALEPSQKTLTRTMNQQTLKTSVWAGTISQICLLEATWQ